MNNKGKTGTLGEMVQVLEKIGQDLERLTNKAKTGRGIFEGESETMRGLLFEDLQRYKKQAGELLAFYQETRPQLATIAKIQKARKEGEGMEKVAEVIEEKEQGPELQELPKFNASEELASAREAVAKYGQAVEVLEGLREEMEKQSQQMAGLFGDISKEAAGAIFGKLREQVGDILKHCKAWKHWAGEVVGIHEGPKLKS